MRFATLVLATALFAAPAVGQQTGWHIDHLEPAYPLMQYPALYNADFLPDFNRLFRDAFAPDVIARLTVEPSFDKQYAVAISHDATGYRIVDIELPLSMAHFKADPDGLHRMESKRCDTAISADLALRLVKIMRIMIAGAYKHVYPKADGIVVRADGTDYEFAIPLKNADPLTATAWSQDKDTKPAALVDMFGDKRRLCPSQGVQPMNVAVIDEDSAALLDRLLRTK